MITFQIDPTVADFLRSTNEISAGAHAAAVAGVQKAVTDAAGTTCLLREISCSPRHAIEMIGWLRAAAHTFHGTNDEFAGQLLKAATQIADAVAPPK